MASKTDPKADRTARGRSPRKPAAAAPSAPAGAKGLLRAGLKALEEVRDDVITRQSRVFEALLGIDPSKSSAERSAREWRLLHPAGDDANAQQKFEEIFDQRVARSLERLGMPSPQALAALCRQLEAINEHLQRIAPAAPPPAPAKKRPRGKRAAG